MKKLITIKLLQYLIIGILVLAFSSCTENQRAKSWGGTEIINLEPHQRLVNVTWKGKEGSDLWILTKLDTTKPTTYTFKEKSAYGVMEGTIILNER